ncbi:hypothetical protein MTR67_031259 [Solanum verrucosum]|uniref:Uncharacterized protein n=1 Tax=Solanum verrucosum TaxID=315347 RepID=A0AAF0U259_SOLVR|nr:hypothetical protein MTR67_031259 [Solanum verrucosum]
MITSLDERKFVQTNPSIKYCGYCNCIPYSRHEFCGTCSASALSVKPRVIDVARFTPITRTLQTRLHRLPRTLELCALIPSLSRHEPTPWE